MNVGDSLGTCFGRWPAGKYPNKGSRFDGAATTWYIVVPPRCAIHSSVGGRVPNMFIQAIWGLVRGNQGDLLRLHIWPTAESCALPVLKNRRHGLIEYMLQLICNRWVFIAKERLNDCQEGINHRSVI